MVINYLPDAMLVWNSKFENFPSSVSIQKSLDELVVKRVIERLNFTEDTDKARLNLDHGYKLFHPSKYLNGKPIFPNIV